MGGGAQAARYWAGGAAGSAGVPPASSDASEITENALGGRCSPAKVLTRWMGLVSGPTGQEHRERDRETRLAKPRGLGQQGRGAHVGADRLTS